MIWLLLSLVILVSVYADDSLAVVDQSILLAVTVDGKWHALDGSSGNLLWVSDHSFPLFSTMNSARGNEEASQKPLFIIEPLMEGRIFSYIPGQVLSRLPLTVKRLVEKSPGRLSDGTIHIGSVRNDYFTVGLKSGEISWKYSSFPPLPDPDRQQSDGHSSVMIGRMEYNVAVYQDDLSIPSFSTHLTLLRGDLTFAGDRSYSSSFDGLICQRQNKRIHWIHKFLQPVVYLFEVVRVDDGWMAAQVAFEMHQGISHDLVNIGHLYSSLYILPAHMFPRYEPLRKRLIGEHELVLLRTLETVDAGKCFPGSEAWPDCLVGQRLARLPFHLPLLDEGEARIVHSSSKHAFYRSLIIAVAISLVLFLLVKQTIHAGRFGRADGRAEANRILVHESQVIGYGSQGTVVVKGLFEGRPIAVKRMLADFFHVAGHEVNLLQESGYHPHVIRYFCREESDRFVYIALELCPASLVDLVESPLADHVKPLQSSFSSPRQILLQMTLGVQHLHRLGIVHRDLKPANILISPPKPEARVLISDFGLSRRLDPNQTSFAATAQTGTVGWRAPECILHEQAIALKELDESAELTPSEVRMTKAVDIFALGCLFYYVLTGGGHAFGEALHEQEHNIVKATPKLSRLIDPEALHLILMMLRKHPEQRPTCSDILRHPFFWPVEKRLSFLADVSDRLERSDRFKDPVSKRLHHRRHAILNGPDETVDAPPGFHPEPNWHAQVASALCDDLGKYRRYHPTSVQDLLRAMRNKRHHYQELPDEVKRVVGETPRSFWEYFHARFPRLLIDVYVAVSEVADWREENPFKDVYFS